MGRKPAGARVLGPYARDDGTFALVLRGPPVPGSPAERWFYFSRLREAGSAKAELEAGLKAGAETSIEEAVEQYQHHLRKLGRQETTIEEAGHRLRPLIVIVGSDTPVERLSKRHVEQRLAGLASVESRRGTLGRTRSFCRWAVAKGLMRLDPTLGLVVEGGRRRGKVTLSRAEARKLDDLLWLRARTTSGSQQEKALAALMLLYCAVREGEFLRLQVRDLDFDAEVTILSVERKAKNRTSFRDMEVPDELAVLLKQRTAGLPLDAWVWPAKKSRSGHREKTWVLKAVKSLCREVGVEVVCPQGLRGTHAKLSRAAGTTARVIADQLGHANTKVTTAAYIGEETDEAQRSRTVLKVLRGGRAKG